MTLLESNPGLAERGQRALSSLDGNRAAWGVRSTPPDRKHYPHTFLWDGAFVAIVRARYGDGTQAAEEVREILSGQHETGLVPNMKFGPGRARDPERFLFNNRHLSSDYTQPPLLAHATREAALALGESGGGFVREVYPKLSAYYNYLDRTRTDPESSLVAIIHPHETGRDSGIEFDSAKLRLPQPEKGKPVVRGTVDKVNTLLDYGSALAINARHRIRRWNVEHARKVFWMKDVMFNAIYAQNLGHMSALANLVGDDEGAEAYSKKSDQVSMDVLTHMWNHKTETFHAVNRRGQKVPEITVSNLFPIILPDVSLSQIRSILNMLEHPDWFGTPYPIPSVPVNSKKFDGSYTERRLWRGPVWMNMNWYIAEGLVMQRDRLKDTHPQIAERLNGQALKIAKASGELVDTEGYREFYDPHKREGKRVKNFAWSTLGDLLKDSIPEMEDFSEQMRQQAQKNSELH